MAAETRHRYGGDPQAPQASMEPQLNGRGDGDVDDSEVISSNAASMEPQLNGRGDSTGE